MKLMTLILVLAMGFPPLQAGYCDMDSGAVSPNQMMAHDHGDAPDHGCCDPGRPDSQDNCGGEMLCGACGISVSTLPVIYNVQRTALHLPALNFSSGEITPSHSPPLYRPPIS